MGINAEYMGDEGYTGTGKTWLNYTRSASLFPSFEPCGSQDGFDDKETRDKWSNKFPVGSWQKCYGDFNFVDDDWYSYSFSYDDDWADDDDWASQYEGECVSMVVGGDYWLAPVVWGFCLIGLSVLIFIAGVVYCCCCRCGNKHDNTGQSNDNTGQVVQGQVVQGQVVQGQVVTLDKYLESGL